LAVSLAFCEFPHNARRSGFFTDFHGTVLSTGLAATPYYHGVARCVRRVFLCGLDPFSGQNYEHRREWIVTKLKSLSTIFSIDICAYAVMSNHYHVILRVDTGEAAAWTQREVIDRWTRLFSLPVLIQRYLRGQITSDAEVNKVNEIVEE